jgi:hypothetical protein
LDGVFDPRRVLDCLLILVPRQIVLDGLFFGELAERMDLSMTQRHAPESGGARR